MKVLLVSSAGGHFSELQKIKLNKKYEKIVVTEKIDKLNCENIDYYLKYGTRSKKLSYAFIFLFNTIKAFVIIVVNRPKLIISTGAHSCVPFFYIGYLFRIKTIYIESYAKVNTPSLTYKLIKNISTEVIVQHEELKEIYDNSKYFGGIY